MLVLQPGAQAPTIQYIAYISTSRRLDAYNTIQCLNYDQVLRRLIYCFADWPALRFPVIDVDGNGDEDDDDFQALRSLIYCSADWQPVLASSSPGHG